MQRRDERTQEDRTLHPDPMEPYGFGTAVMARWKVCTSCGKMMEQHLRYCGECGAPLPQETMYQLYQKRHKCCPACQIVVPDEAQYCPQCGTRFY